MTDTASEILDRAADRLTGHWIQASLGSDDSDPDNCRVCLLGAVNWARNGDPWNCDTMLNSDVLVALEAVTMSHYPVAWNDRPGRTEAEVVAALREAADLVRNRSWSP